MDTMATLAMTAASATVVWAILTPREQVPSGSGINPPATQIASTHSTPSVIMLAGEPRDGDPSARVVVVEYIDFACPYCRKFGREVYPVVAKSYVVTGKVQFVFRHLPLQRLHPSAIALAEGVECAARQGLFRRIHDALLSQEKNVDPLTLAGRAEQIVPDPASFRRCTREGAMDRINADMASALELGVAGTPSFLFATRQQDGRLRVVHKESGSLPASVITRLLDEILSSPVAP